MRLTIGGETFPARLRSDLAPVTCAWMAARLPLRLTLIHARWSGEACWAPIGGAPLGLPQEVATGRPGAGELLVYPGGLSEPELLVPYGPTRFACEAGPLAGNPVLSLTDGWSRLAAVGRRALWQGALALEIDREAAPGQEAAR